MLAGFLLSFFFLRLGCAREFSAQPLQAALAAASAAAKPAPEAEALALALEKQSPPPPPPPHLACTPAKGQEERLVQSVKRPYVKRTKPPNTCCCSAAPQPGPLDGGYQKLPT